MAKFQPSRFTAYLLIAAGLAFFVAALRQGQHAFTALGVVFLVLGIGALRKAQRKPE